MRELVLAVGAFMLVVGLAGCIGSEEAGPAEADPAATDDAENLNPWQRGLAEDYPVPDVAVQRSAEERRADVAEPGDPAFAEFDAAVRGWMKTHNVTAGQFALMEDGQLRYERGYGSTDRAESQPANATTMFRFAV